MLGALKVRLRLLDDILVILLSGDSYYCTIQRWGFLSWKIILHDGCTVSLAAKYITLLSHHLILKEKKITYNKLNAV